MNMLYRFSRWLAESRRNQFLAGGVALAVGGTLVAVGVVVAVSGGGDGEEQVAARTASPSPSATEAPTRTPRRTATASPTSTPEPVETLAFIRNGDIWLINADGSGERRLTQFAGTPQTVVSAEWLNNGRELVYRATYEGGAAATEVVGLVSLDGEVVWEMSARVQLTSGIFWSPDGRLVAIFNPGEDPHARIEDRDGQVWWTGMLAGLSQLKAAPFDLRATWSLDGSALAFIDGEEIVVVSGEPLSARRIDALSGHCVSSPPCPTVYGGLAFAPDHASLVVSVASATGGNELFRVYRVEFAPDAPAEPFAFPSSGEPLAYPSAPFEFGDLPRPGFAPDGSHVAFSTSHHLSACETFARLVILPADGSAARSVVPEEIAEPEAPFSPQGPDTLRGPAIYSHGFIWSPRGDALVTAFQRVDCSFFDQPLSLAEGVYVVPADETTEEKLADEFTSSVPVWSPSGDLIAWATGEPEASTIRLFHLTTRQVTDLTQGDQPAWQPQP